MFLLIIFVFVKIIAGSYTEHYYSDDKCKGIPFMFISNKEDNTTNTLCKNGI